MQGRNVNERRNDGAGLLLIRTSGWSYRYRPGTSCLSSTCWTVADIIAEGGLHLRQPTAAWPDWFVLTAYCKGSSRRTPHRAMQNAGYRCRSRRKFASALTCRRWWTRTCRAAALADHGWSVPGPHLRSRRACGMRILGLLKSIPPRSRCRCSFTGLVYSPPRQRLRPCAALNEQVKEHSAAHRLNHFTSICWGLELRPRRRRSTAALEWFDSDLKRK